MISVGELAASVGVSVRTLRHYDAIGLLRASGRTDGGYRTYDEADAQRLRQIVVEDLTAIGVEIQSVMQRFAELMAAGEPADGIESMAVAEEHRQFVDRWWYPCPPDVHAARANPEDLKLRRRMDDSYDLSLPGLGVFIRTAIVADAAAAGTAPHDGPAITPPG